MLKVLELGLKIELPVVTHSTMEEEDHVNLAASLALIDGEALLVRICYTLDQVFCILKASEHLLQFLLHTNAYAETGVLAEVLAVNLTIWILLFLPLLKRLLPFIVKFHLLVLFQVGVLLFEGETSHLAGWRRTASSAPEIDSPVAVVEVLESVVQLVQVPRALFIIAAPFAK